MAAPEPAAPSFRSELFTAICATFACLKPVDLILCEFDALNHIEVVLPGAWFTESPGVAMVMHGGYDRARDRGIADIEWFLREGALWRRHHEHIEQVAWTAAEMRQTLSAASFDRIRAFDAAPFFTGDSGIRPGCRTFYLARKTAR